MRDKNKREGGEEKLDGGGRRRGKQAIKVDSRTGAGGAGRWVGFPHSSDPLEYLEPRLWVHTDEPHPFPGNHFEGWGQGGIEGIPMGTSDRLGRGRGEFRELSC